MKWSERKTNPRYRLLVRQHQATLRAAGGIEALMAERKVRRASLAALLGKSRSWVTKMLHGGQNLSLFTLVEVASALGHDVEVRFTPHEELSERPKPPARFPCP